MGRQQRREGAAAVDAVKRFAADITGKRPESFEAITGTREIPTPASPAPKDVADTLASLDLDGINEALDAPAPPPNSGDVWSIHVPPSLPFVIYGMMANVSVGALFLAGILPGILMAFLMMLTVAYFAHKNGWGGDIKFEWPRVIKALAETPASCWATGTTALRWSPTSPMRSLATAPRPM